MATKLKICPLFAAGALGDPDLANLNCPLFDCLGARCAWWSPKAGMCGHLLQAATLLTLANDVATLKGVAMAGLKRKGEAHGD